MEFRFENLEIWKEARVFVNDVYVASSNFPRDEMFGMVSQLRRASLSVLLNITEGSDRGSDKEFIRFLRMANTSLQEVIAAYFIALDQKYVTKTEFDEIYQKSHILSKKINALIRYLNKS